MNELPFRSKFKQSRVYFRRLETRVRRTRVTVGYKGGLSREEDTEEERIKIRGRSACKLLCASTMHVQVNRLDLRVPATTHRRIIYAPRTRSTAALGLVTFQVTRVA